MLVKNEASEGLLTKVYPYTYDGAIKSQRGRDIMSNEQVQRLQTMLLHALAGDRVAFDSAADFGEVDREAAERLWKAGRLLALS